MDLLNEMSDDYNIKEVYIDSIDMDKKHDVLKNYDIEDIYKHPMFDEDIYNKYAKLDAALRTYTSYNSRVTKKIEGKLADMTPPVEERKVSSVPRRSIQ